MVKQVLQELSKAVGEMLGADSRRVFNILVERERLGSTGVGAGLAIPHGKLEGLDRLQGVFARLEKPVDFDSIDDEPVDLVFLLLAPEGAGADPRVGPRRFFGHGLVGVLRGADGRGGLPVPQPPRREEGVDRGGTRARRWLLSRSFSARFG